MKKAKTIMSYILPIMFALGVISSPLFVAMAVEVYDNESTTDVVFSSEQKEDEVEHYNYNDDSIHNANNVLSSFGTTSLMNVYLDQKGLDKTLIANGSTDTLKTYAKSLYGDEKYYLFLARYNNIDCRSILTEGQELKIPKDINTIIQLDAEVKEKQRLEEEERVRQEEERKRIEEERRKAEEEQRKKEEERKALEAKKKQASVTTNHSGELVPIGQYRITGYDSCAKCNGSSSGKTASGTMITPGRTVAMKGYPYGTKIYIEGLGYRTIEDTGGFPRNTIDVAVENHTTAAYAITGYYQVYLVK